MPQAKDIADKARALQDYARMANDPQLELDASEIRLRARRRVGELSAALARVVTNSKGWENVKRKRQALSDVGLSTSEANRCEKLAAVDQSDFERFIAAT